MDFDEYEKLASRSAIFNESQPLYRLYDLGLGIAGESGELAEKLKKTIRDDGGTITAERREGLKKEIGDVLWYLSQLSRVLEIPFSEVADANIKKLADRLERDAIKGSGDNR
ncbi:MAG: nucleoside triphosphate pyrophosphohydrolase family protein [Minisyncoccia bacterium]